MKKIWTSAALILLFGAGAAAQPKTGQKKEKKAAVTTERTTLRSESSDQAKATRPFSIADPVVNFYNGRVTGIIPDEEVDRPVIGMPRLRYGVARGKLLFYNTTATGTGGNTGSGSVGTGTSAGNIGMSGVAPGVNGKNPYAGPGIYGNRVLLSGRPVNLPPSPPRDRDKPDQKP